MKKSLKTNTQAAKVRTPPAAPVAAAGKPAKYAKSSKKAAAVAQSRPGNNESRATQVGAEAVEGRAFGLPRSGPRVSRSNRIRGSLRRLISSRSNNSNHDGVEIPHAQVVEDDAVVVVVEGEVQGEVVSIIRLCVYLAGHHVFSNICIHALNTYFRF